MKIGRGMTHVGGMLFPASWLDGPPDPPEHDICTACLWDVADDGHAIGCPNDFYTRAEEEPAAHHPAA